jgi:hypothetical protein
MLASAFSILNSSFSILHWLAPFFRLAAVSPTRQRTFRCLLTTHLVVIALAVGATMLKGVGRSRDTMLLGNGLLVLGIVEGALLIGWRLTQLPKSQALEFLLVSALRPQLVFVGEALVGVALLGLVTLAGLPLLIVPLSEGVIFAGDLPALLLLPFLWGTVTGLALTGWAYENRWVRRWGERLMMAGVIVYLLLGVLAGEHLPRWLAVLPPEASHTLLETFRAIHEYNPFGVMKFAMEQPPAWAWPRVAWGVVLGLLLAAALMARAAWRFRGHFQDEHYRPNLLKDKRRRPAVGDHPLTWWATKRVTKYSGRINLWLASGFAIFYAAYTVGRDAWPSWLGRQVFLIFDDMGGIPALTTALVLLAAVPAAFQYGVWDSSTPDRCRRLELLLLTELDGAAYWHACAGAAWKRGRGYFLAALVLWAAAWIGGQATLAQVLVGMSAGMILWGLYFALGFCAFAKGIQANLLGMGLTIGLPLATVLLVRAGCTWPTGLLPPGSVYLPTAAPWSWSWVLGPLLSTTIALLAIRWALAHCDAQLRRWYDAHQGARA